MFDGSNLRGQKTLQRQLLECANVQDQARLLIQAVKTDSPELAKIKQRLNFRGADLRGIEDAKFLPFRLLDLTNANLSGLDLSGE